MYAIIETGGKQYKVKPGDTFEVELLGAEGAVTFDKVLLVADDNQFEVGTPYVKGASVSAKVIATGKDKKVTTFKYRHKTNYHRTIGHRQRFDRVQIEGVNHGA